MYLSIYARSAVTKGFTNCSDTLRPEQPSASISAFSSFFTSWRASGLAHRFASVAAASLGVSSWDVHQHHDKSEEGHEVGTCSSSPTHLPKGTCNACNHSFDEKRLLGQAQLGVWGQC